MKSCEKWCEKVGKKWGKVGKVGKSVKKWGKSGEKWEKWGKVGKSGEKLEKWGKVANSVICLEFFTKWPLAAILDDRKSLSIAFLAISDQYATFFFFFKMAASSHFGSRFLPKSIGTDLYSRSVARSNMKLIGAFLMKLWSAQAFSSYFHKMAVWRPFWFSDLLQNR